MGSKAIEFAVQDSKFSIISDSLMIVTDSDDETLIQVITTVARLGVLDSVWARGPKLTG